MIFNGSSRLNEDDTAVLGHSLAGRDHRIAAVATKLTIRGLEPVVLHRASAATNACVSLFIGHGSVPRSSGTSSWKPNPRP